MLPAENEQDLLRDFQLYDQYVDVVCVFEALFTRVSELPGTVVHFERYPTVRTSDGRGVTPDFTVLFNDGRGLVGEIGRVALEEESAEACCHQLLSYDHVEGLPDGTGAVVPVEQVDVMFLTPFTDGSQVARRILDRMKDDGHPYSPSHPPCIVQYALEDDLSNTRYVFELIPYPDNGTPREHSRPVDERGRIIGIGSWLTESNIKVRPEHFEAVKVERAFMNDPINPLYMAVHLWTQVFPELAAGDEKRPARIDVSEGDLAELLRDRYGLGRVADVHAAMSLLERAKFAQTRDFEGGWTVAWEQPRSSADSHNLASDLAERVCNPPTAGPLGRLGVRESDPPPGGEQLRLST